MILQKAVRPSRAKGILSFLYLWLVLGFFLGTLMLIGPIRWLTAAVHRAGWNQGVENVLVVVAVLLYVIASAIAARRLSRASWLSAKPLVRYGIPLTATLLAFAALVAWRNPGRMLSALAGGGNIENLETANGAVFEFGAYPDESMLRELKERGVTTVISLQHPGVPVERPGISEENANASHVGIELVHAPMLPWFSENRTSIDKIRAIAATGRGHYYVHCGLGRDRVNIVKKLIEGLGGTAVANKGYHEGLGFENRTVPLARGPIVKLAAGVWLVPFPDHEELYGCFLEGSPGHVVVALDMKDANEKALWDDAKKILDPLAFKYDLIKVDYTRPQSVQRAADSIHHFQPPVTIVVDATEGVGENGVQNPGWESSVALRNAYMHPSSGAVTTGPSNVKVQAAPSNSHYTASIETRGARDTRSGC